MKVAIVESDGIVSRKDLAQAYNYFAKDPGFPSADDDRIINMFHVQQSDQGPAGQEEGREMLARIGRARHSQRLLNTAQQQLENATDAYAWLGQDIGPGSDDAFVTTAYAIRVSPPSPYAYILPTISTSLLLCPWQDDVWSVAVAATLRDLRSQSLTDSRSPITRVSKRPAARQYP